MKKLLVIIFLFVFGYSYSQDLIILKNGDEIRAKVTEILSETIKYKRATNLNGPTYSIEKSKVFMIRYKSGDKDIFNASENTGSVKKQKDKPKVWKPPTNFVYDPSIGNSYCQIRKQTGGKVYGNRGNEIFFRQDIVFYGFDMTYLKLTNPTKLGHGVEIVQKYYEGWNDELTNHVLPIKDIRHWMDKRTMFVGKSVFPNYRFMNYQDFVIANNYCIPYEDLEKIVKSYVLGEKNGLGMVVVLENFNKEREYSLIWVVFFDIATREILFAAETSGKAGGGGMVKHWTVGVEQAFTKMFMDNIYKHRWINSPMIPEKLRFY
ncbi:MAG: hypothetical protein GXO86_13335 [Chlorobi bacterium]|nr:hypothetical protein [Chlorobiota bacterium]